MANDKPMIRHCRNCEYSTYFVRDTIYCDVKYKLKIQEEQRISAVFCRYYKQRRATDGE